MDEMDGGKEIHYRIELAIAPGHNSTDSGTELPLQIDERTGEVFTAGQFDFEQRRHWTVGGRWMGMG